MERQRVATVGLAALCLVSLGVAATTIGSSVATKPDDVVDTSALPLGHDSVADFDREIQANKHDPGSAGHSGSADRSKSTSQSASASSQSQASASGGPGTQSTGGVATALRQSLRDRQGLLARLLALLERLLPVVAALCVAALAYRYRRRLAALLAAPFGPWRGGAAGATADERNPWADATPSDAVGRAWYEMVLAAGVERPWSKTPGECRDAAVAAGIDPETASAVTRAFREARYSDGGPTPEHERLARECRREFDARRRVL